LKILLTNNTLAGRAGTELYVRDIAVELLKRGHTPVAYSTLLGTVAEEIRTATVPVINHLDALATPPDLIHGHHHLETMMALLHFPDVPAIYFCHGWVPWEELPPKFPRILRYVAVDETCRDRLLYEHAIPEERVRVIYNFVDLYRFKPRRPLPEKPRRALVFSNNATENGNLGAVRQACVTANIQLDVIGRDAGNPTDRPEELLPRYDLVFAKGRSALEALSVGTAVVLSDAAGVGPMVTTANMEALRPLNFGIRTLQNPINSESFIREIARYDARDATEVSLWVRRIASMDNTLDQLVALYEEVLKEHRTNQPADLAAELRVASKYLRQWVPNLTSQHQFRVSHEALRAECERLLVECQSRRVALEDENGHLREECQDRNALQSRLDDLQREYDIVVAERNLVRSQLDNVFGSATLRLRNRIIALPWIGEKLRLCARVLAGRPVDARDK
jgi:Glycosyltransferase Family 4